MRPASAHLRLVASDAGCCYGAGVAIKFAQMGNSMKHLVSFLVVFVTFGCALSANATSRGGHLMLAQVSQPEVCTEIYQPVCGTDQNGKRVTYSNACFARVAKASNVTPGECPK